MQDFNFMCISLVTNEKTPFCCFLVTFPAFKLNSHISLIGVHYSGTILIVVITLFWSHLAMSRNFKIFIYVCLLNVSEDILEDCDIDNGANSTFNF